jgi:hypothetical protein
MFLERTEDEWTSAMIPLFYFHAKVSPISQDRLFR